MNIDQNSGEAGPSGGAGGAGAPHRSSGQRGGRRLTHSEDPGEPPPPEEHLALKDVACTTGDESTVRDRQQELEWRHAAGVDDNWREAVGWRVLAGSSSVARDEPE